QPTRSSGPPRPTRRHGRTNPPGNPRPNRPLTMATETPLLDPLDRTERATRLPFGFAKRFGVLAVVNDGREELLVRPDAALTGILEARRYLDRDIPLRETSGEAFDAALQASYQSQSDGAMQMMEGLEEDMDLNQVADALPQPEDLLDSDNAAPILRLINALLTQAGKETASDIHIEPFENRLVVRFRVDGVLREVLQSRRAVAPLVVSRIKVMSKLDIAEKRLPQDGRISLRIAGRAVDVRVSTIPAGHGERV